jgi:hypothetical protein
MRKLLESLRGWYNRKAAGDAGGEKTRLRSVEE